MNRVTVFKFLSTAATTVPFLFGGVRYATTGSDWRYLVTAVASWVGYLAFIFANRSRLMDEVNGVLVVSALASAALAMPVAWFAGARNIVAMLVVTLSFGACFAAGGWFAVRART